VVVAGGVGTQSATAAAVTVVVGSSVGEQRLMRWANSGAEGTLGSARQQHSAQAHSQQPLAAAAAAPANAHAQWYNPMYADSMSTTPTAGATNSLQVVNGYYGLSVCFS
jgi:hypothetical protein